VFDALSRLYQDIAAAGTPAVTTTMGYDNNGNQTSIAAPLARNSTSAYDELNRLTSSTDPNAGVTQYSYNALDQLISVTDPRTLQTTYTYNALGDLTQQASPDTGTTTNTYDEGGNLKTTTDARNVTATYSYDTLNRVTQATYSDQTINFGYDSGSNAVGRISSVSDASGSTGWTYTPQGRIDSKTQVMGSVSKPVGYSYNSAGQLTTLTTPSGKTITYTYANSKIAGIQVNGIPMVSNVLYEPFGPTSGWTWGNGSLAVRIYDTDGKLTQLDSAGLNTYGYDDAFRITGITDTSNSANSQTFNYDSLDRVTSANKTAQSQSFTYDANGNRQTQGGTTSSTFTNATTSNRLTNVTGALTKSYTYDNAGNTTSDGTVTYTYNAMGRMISATKAGVTTTYTYNALGQRVTKTTAGVTTYFVYDEAGHILGEYDQTGALIEEIVWLNDTPVATIRWGSCGMAIFYIHTDHLNTPRKITKRSTPDIVWRWDSDAFGATQANENPSGLGTFAFNLRFPGQYFDQESGLYYNRYRDFDAATGRYIESDPLGIYGGTNTYAYVGGNPLSLVDEFGLQGSPGIGDQINPGGFRGPGSRNYTDWFASRFPNTIAGAKALFDQRIKKKVCDEWTGINAPTSLPGLNSGADDIDIQPDMKRFGDKSQNWYERNVQIGAFELKTDSVSVKWDHADMQCSRCFSYSTVMYVLENTGDNRIPGFRERSVQMGNWSLNGKGCCGGY
jgi:RHS repeat-associated protein